MNKSLVLELCDMQGQLFLMSAERGYTSESFLKAFMNSNVAKDLDKDFHHLQWAGKAYILSALEEECGEIITTDGEIFDRETLYWTGYIYRYWHFLSGEQSKEIYKQSSAENMKIVYYMYHTMSPEMAIQRLKESKNK